MKQKNTLAIDRSIYLMPMFANLVVRDLAAAEALYARIGFATLATIPGPTGPQLLHLRRLRNQDLLVTRGEPATGTMTVSFAAGEGDLAAVASALDGTAATVEGPLDTPWFTTDLRVTDPDGNTIILTAPRAADQEQAVAWVRGGIEGDFVPPGTWEP